MNEPRKLKAGPVSVAISQNYLVKEAYVSEMESILSCFNPAVLVEITCF